ncbi:aspartate carbamoyltransferase regulatory subunit [Nanoarchaeota archaeon]
MSKELSVSAIKEGTVIDHVPSEFAFRVVRILDLENSDNMTIVATNLGSSNLGKKGIIKIGGKFLSEEEIQKIAVLAPQATVNIIKDFKVKEKINVTLPKKIIKVVKCSNPKCITNHEPISTRFSVIAEEPLALHCEYCERNMGREDILLR